MRPPSAGCRPTRRARFREAGARRRERGRSRSAQRTPGKVAIFATCYVNFNEPGIGLDLHAASSSTTRFRTRSSRRKRAAACPSSSSAISSRSRRLKNANMPAARRLSPGRLRDPHRGSFVHAHVQERAAADVSRTTPMSGASPRRCSIRSNTWSRATRTACLKRTSTRRSARSATTFRVIRACRTSDRRRARCSSGSRHHGHHRRALRGARRHVGRQDGVLRDVDENRPAGVSPDGASPTPTTSARIARSPDARSCRGSSRRTVAPHPNKAHPLTLLRIAYGLGGAESGARSPCPDHAREPADARGLRKGRARTSAPKCIAHKKQRTVHLGEHLTLLFEDELTIRYQIQEMLRVEKTFEESGIQDELDAYNPLVPDGSNWKATLLIEYEDVEAGASGAGDAQGHRGSGLGAGAGTALRVYAIADEDLERENEQKTSAVHFRALRADAGYWSAALKRGARARDRRRPSRVRAELSPCPVVRATAKHRRRPVRRVVERTPVARFPRVARDCRETQNGSYSDRGARAIAAHEPPGRIFPARVPTRRCAPGARRSSAGSRDTGTRARPWRTSPRSRSHVPSIRAPIQ